MITAMVTPFTPDCDLDLDGAVTLARWLTEHGSDALVLAGTTGESPVLSETEKVELWRAVAQAVTVPVIAGASTNDTAHSLGLVEAATDAGVDGILLVTPYYNRPSQAGLYDHFSALAAATRLPVLLYDVPPRTGRRIATETILRLAENCPNVVGVKDASHDPFGSSRLLCHAPESFELYSGDDSLNLPLLSIGAVGVISVAAHWAGRELGDMIRAYQSGDVEGARHMNARLVESYEFESTETFPNPLPTKAVCRVLGLPAGECRPPMGVAPPELEGEARRMLVRLGTAVPVGGSVG